MPYRLNVSCVVYDCFHVNAHIILLFRTSKYIDDDGDDDDDDNLIF